MPAVTLPGFRRAALNEVGFGDLHPCLEIAWAGLIDCFGVGDDPAVVAKA